MTTPNSLTPENLKKIIENVGTLSREGKDTPTTEDVENIVDLIKNAPAPPNKEEMAALEELLARYQAEGRDTPMDILIHHLTWDKNKPWLDALVKYRMDMAVRSCVKHIVGANPIEELMVDDPHTGMKALNHVVELCMDEQKNFHEHWIITCAHILMENEALGQGLTDKNVQILTQCLPILKGPCFFKAGQICQAVEDGLRIHNSGKIRDELLDITDNNKYRKTDSDTPATRLPGCNLESWA